MVAALIAAACGKAPVEATDTPPPEACPPDSVLDWDSFGFAFMHTWCTGCHSASLVGDARQGAPENMDLETWEEVVAVIPLIRNAATGDGAYMPPAGGPTADDRDRLREWLDCGAPGATTVASGCGAAVEQTGDVTLASQADADGLCADPNVAITGALTVSATVTATCICEAGSLTIQGSAGAVSLPSLLAVHGDVRAEGVVGLTSLDLPELITVDGSVLVSDTPVLSAFVQKELHKVGDSFSLLDAPAMTTVDLPRLAEVGGDVVIDGTGISDAVGLVALEVIGGSVTVARNASLVDLQLLRFALSLGGDITIVENPTVASVWGVSTLPAVPGTVTLADNPMLSTLSGFEAATTIGGIEVTRNPALGRIDAFGALESTTDDLVINGANILDLAAFADLTAIGGDLKVQNNARLTSVIGLQGVGSVGGDVWITDDPALSQSAVDQLIANIGPQNIGGSVNTWNNGP